MEIEYIDFVYKVLPHRRFDFGNGRSKSSLNPTQNAAPAATETAMEILIFELQHLSIYVLRLRKSTESN